MEWPRVPALMIALGVAYFLFGDGGLYAAGGNRATISHLVISMKKHNYLWSLGLILSFGILCGHVTIQPGWTDFPPEWLRWAALVALGALVMWLVVALLVFAWAMPPQGTRALVAMPSEVVPWFVDVLTFGVGVAIGATILYQTSAAE